MTSLKFYSKRKKREYPLTVEDLTFYFVWDKSTNDIYWAERPASMFADGGHTKEHNAAAWNAKNAGKLAFKTNSHGYLVCSIGRLRLAAHRVIWTLNYGEWPDGQIDHINHIRTDNRLENLRCVTHAENTKNKRLLSSNTSGICGVSWTKTRSKWRANIKINGRVKYLGTFVDINDAIAVRKAAEVEYGFHPNHGMAA